MEMLTRLTRRQLEALQTIEDRARSGDAVPLRAIAAAMRVRPPSALAHVTVLEQRALVSRYRGKTRLTERGRATLGEYRRHHRVAENLFRSLGLSAADTHSAALEVDLAMSHRLVNRICAAEGHPRSCPHGQEIAPCDAPGARSP